jgi:glutamate-1-semialdehyde 2,1-aminomutase
MSSFIKEYRQETQPVKTYSKSGALFERAQKLIPGGVNSPVRACRSVGMSPLFIDKAAGSKLTDADGNQYIDYVGSWGPMILGHSHPAVIQAIEDTLKRGTSFGAPVDLEVELAELIVDAVPSVEKVRMVNSGTEAAMSVVRLARGVTGRNVIVKFDGCYHGHADSFLVAAGSGVATLNIAGSPGVPDAVIAQTLSLPYNDAERFAAIMEKFGDTIAAVIVEPVAGNMGLVPPVPGFLETLREKTAKFGSLLIFDEVMTGFRVNPGGVQGLFGLSPHLTCLGKIVGGGLPIGAFGGRAGIMDRIAPEGDVYQAGTLSGNPLAVTAGLKTLELLKNGTIYPELESKSSRLCLGLEKAAEKAGIPVRVPRCGSMFTVYFSERPVTDFSSAKKCDLNRFKKYFNRMLEQGIYLAPSQFEACFVSAAHDGEAIEKTLEAAENAFAEI